MPRIVTLLPSATEIVAALGMAEHLVGRSHECDYPPTVADLPICTEPRFDPASSSGEVDRRVKDLLGSSGAVYRVLMDTLERLAPDVLITQTQCEVCAVSLSEVEAAARELTSSRPRIVTLRAEDCDGIMTDIQRVADGLGVAPAGRELIAGLQARIERVAEKSRTLSNCPRTLCLEWLDPLMAGGNWMPELVEMAGGRSLMSEAGRHSPWIEWDAVREADPEVVVLLPCGFDIARTRAEAASLLKRDGWERLAAVRSGRVYVADGNQYFNRPGPRIVESLEIMAEMLHPAQFRFGHEGRGWVLL